MLADRRAGGAGPQRRVYTAVRADSGANRTARAAGSTPTRQPCARGSRSDGWPSSTALLRRVQASGPRPCGARGLYGCSTRDPLLRKIRRKKPAPPPLPENHHPRTGAGRSARAALRVPPPANGTATGCWEEGHFYAGNAVVPPGSMRGAAYRYGGRGASTVNGRVRRPYQ